MAKKKNDVRRSGLCQNKCCGRPTELQTDKGLWVCAECQANPNRDTGWDAKRAAWFAEVRLRICVDCGKAFMAHPSEIRNEKWLCETCR
jgi:hypothetical protein